MSAAVQTLDEPTLDELVEVMNREHQLAGQSGQAEFSHMVASGHALIIARSRIAHGDWLGWLDEHFAGALTTAYRYMKFATNAEWLYANGATKQTDAERMLRESGRDGVRVKEAFARPQMQAAQDLQRDGLSLRQIADVMDVSKTTASVWCNPSRYDRIKLERKKYAARRRAEKLALERLERDAAMRKIQGPRSAAYSLVRRLAQTLDQAHAEAQTREIRAALNEAIAAQHKLEDAIVRASKLS